MPNTLPTRSELDPRYTWDFAAIYPDEKAWSDDLDAAAAEIPKLAAYHGRLAYSGSVLHSFLEEYFALQKRCIKLGAYAFLPGAVDQEDQAARARAGRFQAVNARFSAEMAFRDPELLAAGAERIQDLLREEPALERYRRFLERIEERRPHVRSAEVEQVVSLAGDPLSGAGSAYRSLTDADMRFRPVEYGGTTREVAQSSIDALVGDVDREVRRLAFESYADGYLEHRNTLTDLYVAAVKRSAFSAKVRGYPSAVDAVLDSKEEKREQLNAVIDAFKANVSTWHRYWAARRRALGVDKLAAHDVFAPLSSRPITVTYEQAMDWVIEGHRPLGDDYLRALEQGLRQDRWVDAFPNKGKRQGAFCSSNGDHSVVFMSFTDDVPSVGTLAHELGHAMNFHYTRQAQPPVYYGANRLEVEVPSNCSQALTRAHLLESNPDRDFQLAVLDEAFWNFHRYFFQMPLLARFELAVHDAVDRGEGLTADKLNAIMGDLLREGYGSEIEVDDRSAIVWAEFGHLYAPFYTFEYTVGISSAAAIAQGILEGREGAIEGYIRFLSAGNSVPTGEGLRMAGVDISTPEPIERGFQALARLVDRLESLIDCLEY